MANYVDFKDQNLDKILIQFYLYLSKCRNKINLCILSEFIQNYISYINKDKICPDCSKPGGN